MPIVREPSQRTKAWVKWNYGQNSSKVSLNSAPSEIIHLGGSRVGTPEPSPGRPATAQGHDRPCTTWFPSPYAPPPEPPLGIARSRTDPHDHLSPVATPSSFETMSSQLSPAPLSLPSGKIPSPLPSATTSSFSKVSSPPPYYSASPISTSSESSRQLRRTQSATDIQKRARVRSKALPPKPMESHDESESDTQESPNATHVGQLIREDAQDRGVERVTRWFPIPPLTSPPPTKPLPAIRSISPTSSEGSKESPKLATSSEQQVVQTKGLPQRPTSRLSPQERLWLHRNYRGEATFLKAWGLSIEKAEDREEGVNMMRELMEAEDEKKRAKKAQKAKDLGLPDGGLQIIIEEEKGSLSEPDKPSPRMINPTSAAKPQGLRVPGRGYASPTERHLRSESESSVLGAYLDIRMSRMD
ncbi:hypothetical protein AB5N19_05175 [Seiridium cardinale]